MRISDWSSDVCSSDLLLRLQHAARRQARRLGRGEAFAMVENLEHLADDLDCLRLQEQSPPVPLEQAAMHVVEAPEHRGRQWQRAAGGLPQVAVEEILDIDR